MANQVTIIEGCFC